MRSARTTEKGSALIAVYWVIALLSLSVFTTATILTGDVESRVTRSQLYRAEQLAEMGIAIASHPTIKPGDKLLTQRLSDTEAYEASIESETGRININATLVAGERQVLEQLFVSWELSESEAIIVVDSLIDWVDNDDEVTGDGAEQELYAEMGQPGYPLNRQFISLDEMSEVRGMDLVAATKPGWQRAFTLWGNGRLDLADANPELISAVCECPLANAQSYVAQRRGLDGVENTEDDFQTTSLDEILDYLGVPDTVLEDVKSRVGLGGSVDRLRSVGTVGDVKWERVVIVQGRRSQVSVLDVQQRRL